MQILQVTTYASLILGNLLKNLSAHTPNIEFSKLSFIKDRLRKQKLATQGTCFWFGSGQKYEAKGMLVG